MTNRRIQKLNGSHGSKVLDAIFEVSSGEQVSRVYLWTTHNDLNFDLQYLKMLYNFISNYNVSTVVEKLYK